MEIDDNFEAELMKWFATFTIEVGKDTVWMPLREKADYKKDYSKTYPTNDFQTHLIDKCHASWNINTH